MFRRWETIRAALIEQKYVCLFCIEPEEINKTSQDNYIRNRHLASASEPYFCSRCKQEIYSI